MIYGIGIDIIEIKRIERAVKKHSGFTGRIFTQEEVDCCRNSDDYYASMAARFAAKESFVKALGQGFDGFSWRNIEVLRQAGHPPRVMVSAGAKKAVTAEGINNIHISLSHNRDNAMAVIILEK